VRKNAIVSAAGGEKLWMKVIRLQKNEILLLIHHAGVHDIAGCKGGENAIESALKKMKR
jgi:TATA-box binding protein (TBP) (component of TFIID and TFIIIB)